MIFERLDLASVDWAHLDSFGDRTIFQTRPWLDFIAATQRVDLVVAALREGRETRGYFTGGIVRKFGLPMLGSPFPGWTSSYLGFNLPPGVSREAALHALEDFAFHDLNCVHLELMDRRLTEVEARNAGFDLGYLRGYEVDLSPSEEKVFANLKDDCRWRIRKAAKSGVVVEEASDAAFADEYYDQLIEVFARRQLTPTYDRDRVRALVEHLHPSGMLLLLRARDAEGRSIATGIFPAFNDTAYYWGGASWRAYQSLSPNEAIQWYAIRYWKARGITRYDMGGGGNYKAKYGGDAITVPWVRRSKYAFLARQRDRAKRFYWFTKRVVGRIKAPGSARGSRAPATGGYAREPRALPGKPPILLIGNLLSATLGVRSASEDLAARLSAKGWRVLTASEKPGPLARVVDMAATVWRRRKEYEAANVEVFSGPAFCWAEIVCLLLTRLGKPFILTLHGGNLPAFARRWPRRVRRLLRSAVFVTTPSHYLREQMATYRSDSIPLPNPLDLAAYDFRTRLKATPKLIWLRAFHKLYNPTLAPCAVEHLTREFPDVQLEMIGPDKGDGSTEEVRQRIASRGLSQRIRLLGAIAKSDVSRHLNRGDIFLNTANADNAPVSVLEAMACGLCIVSTNVGGIPYLLEHEYDALLVPPEDSMAMAAAVRRILNTPALAETLSRNARGKAEQFDWTAILPQWERLFEMCAERKRGNGKI